MYFSPGLLIHKANGGEWIKELNAFEEHVQFSWKKIVIHFSDHWTSSSRWLEPSYTVFAFSSLSTGTSERHNLTPGQNVFPLCVEKIFLIKLFLFFIEHFKDLFSTKTYHNRLISLSACLRVKWAVPEDSPRVLIQTTSPFSPSTQDLWSSS